MDRGLIQAYIIEQEMHRHLQENEMSMEDISFMMLNLLHVIGIYFDQFTEVSKDFEEFIEKNFPGNYQTLLSIQNIEDRIDDKMIELGVEHERLF